MHNNMWWVCIPFLTAWCTFYLTLGAEPFFLLGICRLDLANESMAFSLGYCDWVREGHMT